MIREKVMLVFPQFPQKYDILDQEYLKVCVAQGAALYGLIRSGIQKEQHVRLVAGGRRLPHAYGVQVMRGFTPFFEPIIKVGEEYPTVGEKEYTVDEIPRSGILNLKFLQNSGSSDRIKGNPDIRVIGSKTIDTLIDKKPGCDIKVIIDANRKMEVTADEEMVEIEPVRLEEEGRWIG
jgi:molecular chaperone DnaK (HSP70)